MVTTKQIQNLNPEIAKVIVSAAGTNSAEVKNHAKFQLSEMLHTGQITEAEYQQAKGILRNRPIRKAIAAGNRINESVDNQKLNDKKAQALMEEAGLTVDDLYQVAQRFVGDDNKLSYTHLNLSKYKEAKAGEETESERFNVLNALNNKIKENGGERVLTLKEAKRLMKGLGCDIEKMFDPAQMIASSVGGAGAGAGLGAAAGSAISVTATATATAEATVVMGGAVAKSAAATATAVASGTASGAATLAGFGGVAGFVVGATAFTLASGLRKEAPYGTQGGEEGGQNSVTNKTEAMMKALKDQAEKVE